jgi:hypothetical protein
MVVERFPDPVGVGVVEFVADDQGPREGPVAGIVPDAVVDDGHGLLGLLVQSLGAISRRLERF